MNHIIDDGFNAELVETAYFDGVLEIPIIERPETFVIPSGLVPYTQINKAEGHAEFVHFYEHDLKFRDILSATRDNINPLRRFAGVISPDFSLYRDMPLVLQFANTYMNRAVGHFLQQQGLYVVPNIRWGDERSYSSGFVGEKVAFLGVPRHSIVSISTYGCIRGAEDKYHFKAGLEAMLDELEPEIVLVYGAMPESVFGDYIDRANFHQYPNWISLKRKKAV